jgi:hypothetical protein
MAAPGVSTNSRAAAAFAAGSVRLKTCKAAALSSILRIIGFA